jgi:translation initiation factor IF-1
MKITEVISQNAFDGAKVSKTTPKGEVVLQTKDGTEITINDPSKLYKDPKDGKVHLVPDDNKTSPQMRTTAPQMKTATSPTQSQAQKMRPGDKVVVDKSQTRSF